MLQTAIKPRTCTQCPQVFTPCNSMQTVCSPACAIKLGRGLAKVRAVAQKAERQQTKQRRQDLKRLPDLIREAQTAFNAFIRERDRDQPCICCGRMADDKDLLTGSRWDAGHYRSTGSASHLRFNEANCHRQLVVCNRHGAGRAVDYRIGLVKRIGLEAVEALESNNTARKWEREELVAIKAMYVRRLKALRASRETETA